MVEKATTLPGFNPTNDPRVKVIKDTTEELIEDLRALMASGDADKRCAANAIDSYELAAMWAVKSLFVK